MGELEGDNLWPLCLRSFPLSGPNAAPRRVYIEEEAKRLFVSRKSLQALSCMLGQHAYRPTGADCKRSPEALSIGQLRLPSTELSTDFRMPYCTLRYFLEFCDPNHFWVV